MKLDHDAFERFIRGYVHLSHNCSIHGCRDAVVGWMYAPDDTPVPGGAMCKKHGERAVKEYAEKLNESWKLLSSEEHSRRTFAYMLETG